MATDFADTSTDTSVDAEIAAGVAAEPTEVVAPPETSGLMAVPAPMDGRLAALPAQQQSFAAAALSSEYGVVAQSFGFDPISLITLILPIAMEMLKQCGVGPAARVRQVKKKTALASVVMRRAVQRAQTQYRVTYGGVKNAGTHEIAGAVLDLASTLPEDQLSQAF